MDTDELIAQAFEYYEEGNMEKAESICLDLLQSGSENTDVYHCLGLIHIHNKRYSEAIVTFEKIIQHDVSDAYAYYNLATVYQAIGEREKAADHFRKAIEYRPSFDDALYNLGIVLNEMGETDQAIAAFRNAVALNPSVPDAYINLGTALRSRGNLDDAILSYKSAIALDPSSFTAFNNLGLLLQEKGLFDDAIQCYRKAAALNPLRADIYINLGSALKAENRLEEAAEYFKKAIETDPSFAPAYYNLGTLYEGSGDFDAAIPALQKAIVLDPGFGAAYNNLAMALEAKGDSGAAIKSYRLALSCNPSDPEIHWNLSHALLRSGSLEEGWKKYEWRFLVKDFPYGNFPCPAWDGSSLQGKRLLVFTEQGIGEEMMFASCLPDVLKEAAVCIVECDKRLIPLFSRSFPGILPLERMDDKGTSYPELASPDMRIAIGSLPKYFRSRFSHFPDCRSYLIPDKEKVLFWRTRFSSLGNGMKVGISWRGGRLPAAQRLRSTVLEQWAGLLNMPGVCFVNLQYGDCTRELEDIRKKFGIVIHDWEDTDPLKDMDSYAALISALDLVISVDNAAVHMAGALGVPTLTLLPFSCDWRWMEGFEDTPWYPVMRLLRQSNPGDWKPVFEKAAALLDRYAIDGSLPDISSEKSYKRRIETTQEEQNTLRPGSASLMKGGYTCAVITPVGPGHEALYEECLGSLAEAFRRRQGCFSTIIPIRVDDREGALGRSRARNIGIDRAAKQRADWIFFLDADDLMNPSAFEYVAPYLSGYDAVWGNIWVMEKGEKEPKERPRQLPFLYRIEDVLSFDPFITLQMGHFVKTSVAESALFNESLDTGEDFDYYLRVWDRYRCIKIPLPFFYNRRGLHSQGPRSATGRQWRKQVDRLLEEYFRKHFTERRENVLSRTGGSGSSL